MFAFVRVRVRAYVCACLCLCTHMCMRLRYGCVRALDSLICAATRRLTCRETSAAADVMSSLEATRLVKVNVLLRGPHDVGTGDSRD